MTVRSIALAAALAALPLALGCATTPYPMAAHGETDVTLALPPGEPQFERGEPNAVVDGLGHYFFSLPTKLILFSWKVDNHDVPPEVEEALRQYLHANGLCRTKVRLNQYAPGGEWRRLFANREMPAGWRYTLGVLSLVSYTVFPERLFAGFPFIGGGDHFNPYTNTVSIYSGSRPIALHEGGHAKDHAAIEGRHVKGIYAGARAFPYVGIGVALYQEAKATNDAFSWELATAGSAETKAAYRTLYPAYSTYIGSGAGNLASIFTGGWVLYAIQYGTVIVGHAVGQTRAAVVDERADGLEPALQDLGSAASKCEVLVLEPQGEVESPPSTEP
jgi:hypothetical protein